MKKERKKEKLTLSVDKEVVEKAKKLGINISDLTEKVLAKATITKDREVVSMDDIYQFYWKTLKLILPWLRKFHATVLIGFYEYEEKNDKGEVIESGSEFIKMDYNGWLVSGDYNDIFGDIRDFPTITKLKMFEINSNLFKDLIDALLEASEKNKEMIRELEMYKRVFEALEEPIPKKRGRPDEAKKEVEKRKIKKK